MIVVIYICVYKFQVRNGILDVISSALQISETSKNQERLCLFDILYILVFPSFERKMILLGYYNN
jgi:hypothetical protein